MLLEDLRLNLLRLLEDIHKHEAEKGADSDYISFLAECKSEAEKVQSNEDITVILHKLQHHNEFKRHFSSNQPSGPSMSRGNTEYAERLKSLEKCVEPATLELVSIESSSDSTQTPPVSPAMAKTALNLSQTPAVLDEKDFSILNQEDLATPNQKASEALDKEEKLKQKQFLAIKQALKASNTSAEKQHVLDSCTTLQQLCFAAAVRRKGGFFHQKHTTTTGDLLLQLLKRPEYNLLKQDIFPGNQRVSMRGIRHYGRYGTHAPQHGYFLNTKARDDENFFSLSNNPDKNQPMLLFDRYFKNNHNSSYDHDYSAVENLNP
ncbi:hypothetical protein AVI51_00630 [Piscirickettsia salmonis]|uniref:Uncharacterized protein n=2 Tax=Piscirickettsia salmonis TaxID=1238 RepID=A0A9Q5V9A3_PISSA|nr:hypothetical protein [Piscirickettsia salmonis]ALA24556.1 rasGEF domain protein [Piscirickettsia salmonis]APS44905.1 hypothetical protein AVI48_11360 [Piscirickettsia salmonis]APS48267.1 hypothetical protein AVI49_11970 [Piscirickettsia salmonis]APS49528.1 hypothetical protein AVI50_00655 [Piscirickettsia salmonis]APS52709.1 hypothetical protein AVI51_00630 [Piscirickettsia salmonis]